MADGTFLRQWGGRGAGPGQFSHPFDVAVKGNEVLVADGLINHRVQVFGLDGTFVLQWGGKGVGPGHVKQACGVAVVGGEVVVCDLLNHRVQVFK